MMTLSKRLGRILLTWIVFLIILNVLSCLSHYPMHFLSWVNYSLYFLLGVLAFFVALKEKYLKDIFSLFALAFLAITSTLLIYVGREQFDSASALWYYLFFYSRITVYALLVLAIIHLVVRYVFASWSRGLALALSLFLMFVFEFDFWVNLGSSDYAIRLSTLGILYHMLRLDLLALLSLMIYFVTLFLTRRPNASFIHYLAVALLLLISFDLFDTIVSLREINVYGVDQYFLVTILIFLAGVFFVRLLALHSASHMLREQFILDPNYAMSSPVVMHDTENSLLLSQLKMLMLDKNVLLQAGTLVTILLFSALSRSFLVSLKIVLIIVLLLVIWNLYYHIFRKRFLEGQVLNQNNMNRGENDSSGTQSIWKK